MKFTAKTTAATTLAEGKTDDILWDDALPGFGLRLRLSGGRVGKTFVAQYRAHGRTRRMKIGAFEKVTLEAAREAARKILAKAELGGDPQADKTARRQQDAHTLAAAAADYLAAKRKTVRPATFRELNRYLTGPHFKPLHLTPLDRITRRDVAARLTKIIAEHSSITARRARAALSALYAWALGHGLCEVNPVVGTIAPADAQPRSRVLTDAELVAIWKACGDDSFGKLVKLCVLLGARRSEIGGMRWSELDIDTATWVLPAARSKNRREHTLPLMPMALEIIATVPRLVGRDHLFGERSDHGFTQWCAKQELDARLGGEVGDWDLHDVRRSVATRLADLGIAPHIIEQLLNHISGHKLGVAGVYNRSSYEREVKAALALWADHVRALVEGTAKKVVPLRA
jgi:integrase